MTQAKEPGQLGRITYDDHGANLHFERTLAHPAAKVWASLTDPALLGEWYGARDVTIEPRQGGRVAMTTGPAAFRWSGEITIWEVERLLEYSFNAEPHPHLPDGEKTILRYELEPVADGTLLRVHHRHLSKPTALGFAPGTHALLDRLEAQLDGEPLPDFMARSGEVRPHYPAWES